jgi:uncharacterized protein YabE (DUF348 family)
MMNEAEETQEKSPAKKKRLNPIWLWVLSVFLIVAGITTLIFSFYREYTLLVDDIPYTYKTIAFRGRTLLKNAGLELDDADRVSIDIDTFSLQLPSEIKIDRARQVTIIHPSKTYNLKTAARYPSTLLQLAGIKLFPNDIILQNNQPIDPYASVPLGQEIILEYVPAKLILLNDNGQMSSFSSQTKTLDQAFIERNINIGEHDRISVPPSTELSLETQVEIRRAREISATRGENTTIGYSAADNAEEALLEIGLPLQNLDYIAPSSVLAFNQQDSNLFLDIVQVSESYELIKEETAYTNTYELDPNAELDTTSILVPGQTGYVVTRTISISENGEEVKTFPSQHWKASDPVDGVIGRGTKPVIKTETVDGVTLEYWRKVSVYATSYHPSEFPPGARTRSGSPVTKGIIAVSAAWYPSMAGQRVYVPGYGYGIIGDSGGGIPGRYWIDLAYDDENYIGWHHWTTLYFLTPIPAYIPAVLP